MWWRRKRERARHDDMVAAHDRRQAEQERRQAEHERQQAENTRLANYEYKRPTQDLTARLLTPDESAELRRRFLEGPARRRIGRQFELHQMVRSATLVYAQYWDDDAHDQVHTEVVYSELDTPDLDAARIAGRGHWAQTLNDRRSLDSVNLPSLDSSCDLDGDPLSTDYIESMPVTLFAAFCVEGADQNDDYLENYRPVAIYRRTATNELDVELIGEMPRPWLDGIASIAAAKQEEPDRYENFVNEIEGYDARWEDDE